MPDNDSFPIPEGTPPHELRGSATVVKRAAKLKRKLGYDPLDPEVIERARERKRQWAKMLSRQVALAVLSVRSPSSSSRITSSVLSVSAPSTATTSSCCSA